MMYQSVQTGGGKVPACALMGFWPSEIRSNVSHMGQEKKGIKSDFFFCSVNVCLLPVYRYFVLLSQCKKNKNKTKTCLYK